MIGDILMIVAGLAFISSFFPWLRFYDVRRQRKQLERGEQNSTLIRSSDRAFPAIAYLSGALMACAIFDAYLAIVVGLMLFCVILYWIFHIKRKNRKPTEIEDDENE